MRAKLVCYSLGKIDLSTRRKLHRELYGYKDISNNGKYVYIRKGLVDSIKCKKIMDSVILTTQKNASILIEVLNKHNARIHVFTVILKGAL